MPLVDAVVECPIHDSFRVRQVAGMFDVPLAMRVAERFRVEVPDESEAWSIGVIAGPSGSGKSTIARAAYGDAGLAPVGWPSGRAVIDSFGDLSIRDITGALTAVGFSSPPAWIKPYAVLSNGEKFRCDLARALLTKDEPHTRGMGFQPMQATQEVANSISQNRSSTDIANTGCKPVPRMSLPLPLTLFDEFTSVVDRTVAKIGSAAVSKAIRSGRIARRFVAITCHYDVIGWLEPDWVLDMATGKLARGRLRRPEIRLDIRRCSTDMWNLFKRHHYLSSHLHRSSTCFVGCVDGSPACFTAVLFFPHPTRPGWKEHRTVCLPDFQGVGLGNAMSEFVASLYRATGKPYYSTTSHPSMIRHRCRSPLWRVTRKPQTITRPHASHGMAASGSVGRLTAGFAYAGPSRPEEARGFGLAVAFAGGKSKEATVGSKYNQVRR